MMKPRFFMGSAIIPRTEDEFTVYEATPTTRKRGRAISIVWQHFDKLKDEIDDVWKTQCRHCKQIYSSAQKNGTSHLKRHLDRCPKIGTAGLSLVAMSTPFVKNKITNHETSNKRSRSISKVWEDFEKLKPESDDILKARCVYCKQVLSGASKYGTSHLKRHLDRCPKRKNHDVRQFLLSSEAQNIKHLLSSNETLADGSTLLKKCKLDQNEIFKAISTFVVCGNYPVSVVQEFGFRHMMSVLCPQYEDVNPHAIRKDAVSDYVRQRDNVKELFAGAPGRICLTCDSWSCVFSKDEYLRISAHFINNDWKLLKKIIRFKLLTPPLDGISIAGEVALSLNMWNIDSKVFSITSDNATYSDSMINSLRRSFLVKRNLLRDGAFFQVRCCSQNLNLIVQASLNLVQDIIDKIRGVAIHIRKSTSRKRKFYEMAARDFQLDMKRRIRPNVYYRWNTTYMMIDSALYYRRVLQSLEEQDSSYIYYRLSEEEWEKLIILQKFLSVFYDVECTFSALKHPTANSYFRALWKVHMHLLKTARGPYTFMTCMVKDMQEKFEKYWTECNLIVSCAAVLDPRYKVKLIEFCYTKVFGDKAEEFVNATIKALYNFFDEYKSNSLTNSSGTRASAVTTTVEDENIDSDEFEDYELFLSRKSRMQDEKSQLDLYLEEPSHDLNSDLDVLEYWSKSSMRYPELTKMARDILTIPISSVPSEEIFSIGKKILYPGQISLNPKMAQTFICLSDWTCSTLDKSSSYSASSGTGLSILQEYDVPSASDEEDYHEDWDIEDGSFY